jgi:diaminohydroxyphosphoribosylaminopyrimidine deaminase/5-amino-6-(5-phosphoribosylamino)uracil reductase
MMPPMPTPELLTPPPEVTSGALADIPSDWPVLWLQMLQAREGGCPPLLRHTTAHGWVLQGECSTRSRELFTAYKPMLDARVRNDRSPWVVAQLGQSLDGFVATATGDSYYVNGAHGLLHLHRLRALCDAVVVGARTVATDDPQLTTRRVPGPAPVRVVMDSRARLDGRSRVFRDGQSPSLWVCDARHAETARQRLQGAPDSVQVLAVEGLLDESNPTACYRAERAVEALGRHGLRLLFVEGGGVTVSRFFGANALDRLHLVVAPVLIGSGRRGLQVPASDVMVECPRPPARTLRLGDDMLWDLGLRS